MSLGLNVFFRLFQLKHVEPRHEAKLFDEEMEVLHVTQDGKFTGRDESGDGWVAGIIYPFGGLEHVLFVRILGRINPTD
jgi:hypothetical protein